MTPKTCCYGGVLTGGLLEETEEKDSTKSSTIIPLYSELRTAQLLTHKEAMGLMMPC